MLLMNAIRFLAVLAAVVFSAQRLHAQDVDQSSTVVAAAPVGSNVKLGDVVKVAGISSGTGALTIGLTLVPVSVPDPATACMALAGLAVAATARRRRKACGHVILTLQVLLPLVTPALAQDQTTTGTGAAGFSSVTNWSADSRRYQISLQSHTWSDPANPLPGLQSFASAVYDHEWVMVAGRTNGMHDFTNSGDANFPPNRQNVDVWVVNPVTQQTWHRSLADNTNLSLDQLSRLSATNTESFQRGDGFFVAGGYGSILASASYDSVTGSTSIVSSGSFVTHNSLTAIHLPDLVGWVKSGTAALSANAVTQIAGSNDYFAVTGGEMVKTSNNQVHLVFGQNFQGPYTGASNGVYTSQVRSFTLDYNPGSETVAPTLAYSPTATSPVSGDATQFRRRDLNVAPSIRRDPSDPAAVQEGMIAYAGVFTGPAIATGTGTASSPGNGVWTLPVEISATGTPTMIGTTSTATSFVQPMNQYAAAHLGVYSGSTGDFTTFLLGGITANTYDPQSGTLTYQAEYPFTNQITAVTRDVAGGYRQQYVGEYPFTPLVSGTRTFSLYGAEAKFFTNSSLPANATYANGVFNLDELLALGSGTIGYMFGGIASSVPNTTSRLDSTASPQIFSVIFTPVPEPSVWCVVLAGLACGASAMWRQRKPA